MHLVQILLPIYRPSGERQPEALLNDVRDTLTSTFGGVTAYSRAPAEGVWKSGKGQEKDEIIIVEVMVESVDVDWWRTYRQNLENLFAQEEIIVRTSEITML